MLGEGQGSVQGDSQVFWEAVIFEGLAIPSDIELCVCLVVVKMESANLCFARVGIESILCIVVSKGL